MEIYLDNAATTKPFDELKHTFANFQENFYQNPSSLHYKGFLVSKEIQKTKDVISKNLGVSESEIFFTSGGTESNNTIIFGVNHNGRNIVYSKNQHPSITTPIEKLGESGVLIKKVSSPDGKINKEELIDNVDEKTSLVCLTHINNETGAIEDIKEIAKLIKLKNPKTIFHVDGVQSFAKVLINLPAMGVDSFSFSSHKVHGLKGTGGLFIKKGINIKPLIFGGEQQNRFRPGTENTFSILAFKTVLEKQFKNILENQSHVKKLRKKLLEIKNLAPHVLVNENPENNSDYILNLSFEGISGEVLLNALSEKNIFVSTGSACMGGKVSSNLLNHGYDKKRAFSAIRFSFSVLNTESEIEEALKILYELVRKFRK